VVKLLAQLAPQLQRDPGQLWAFVEGHTRAPFFVELLSQLAALLAGSDAQKQVRAAHPHPHPHLPLLCGGGSRGRGRGGALPPVAQARAPPDARARSPLDPPALRCTAAALPQSAMALVIEKMGPLAYKKLAQLLRNVAVAQSRGDNKRVAQVCACAEGGAVGHGGRLARCCAWRLPGRSGGRGLPQRAARGAPVHQGKAAAPCAALQPRSPQPHASAPTPPAPAPPPPPPMQGARLLQHWQASPQFYEHTMRLVSELGAGAHRSSLMVLLLQHSLDCKGLLDALSSGATGGGPAAGGLRGAALEACAAAVAAAAAAGSVPVGQTQLLALLGGMH
jgi:hypothetical protein